MQKLMIAGTVGKDAVLRNTQGGDDVLSFSVAVDNGKDKNGERRASTWFDCSLWGVRASKLERYVTKGSKLTLIGRPTAREHEGKVYLGITVDDLTFMSSAGDRQDGGGQREERREERGSYGDQRQGSGYGAGGRPGGNADLDDEVPFSMEWR